MRRWLLVVMVVMVSTMSAPPPAWSCPYPAMDRAAKEIPASMRDVEAEAADRIAPPAYLGDRHSPRGDTPIEALYAAVTFTLLGLVLALLIARQFRRMTALRGALPVAVSLLVVEQLARAAQRRGGVLATIGIVGVPALVAMDAGVLAIISTIVGAIGVRRFCIARSVLQLLEAAPGRVTAEVTSHFVVVHSLTNDVQLDVAPGALAHELRHAVPTARAKQR